MKRALAVLLALLGPAPALACAACVSAVDRNRVAFLITTILLSLLPLAMIGAGLWWIARHARGRLAGEFEDRDSLPAAAPPGGTGAPGAAATPRAGAAGALFASPGTGRER